MSEDKINLIQDEILQTTNKVKDSISLVIDRGEKLENLVDKSENLNDNAKLFNIHAKKLKWKMFMKKVKITALLIFIIFLIIMIILFFACGLKLQC